VREELLFAVEAATVPGEVAGRSDDAVARDDDADRVLPVGQTDRSGRPGFAETLGELAVRGGLAVRDLLQRGPDLLLERSSAQPERKVEAGTTAREVLAQLDRHLRQQRGV